MGSASWITDASGTPIQHLQYCPFGEPFVNQHTGTYQERFTFTGKERDEETGYGYFGARYMDADLLTSWLSVDPMADKYPSLSPYNYCAWNPIKLVDPKGEEMTVFKDEEGNELYKTDDGSNAVFTLAGGNGKSSTAYFQFTGFDKNQGGSDEVNFNTLIDYSEKYSRDLYTNENNGTTYCNYAARFVAKSFISGAYETDFDVPDISFLNGGTSTIFDHIPQEHRLSGDADATAKAEKKTKGQHLSLVFGCTKGHIIAFTTNGDYSNVGGSKGNTIQTYHWLVDSEKNGIKVIYFSLDVMRYRNNQ